MGGPDALAIITSIPVRAPLPNHYERVLVAPSEQELSLTLEEAVKAANFRAKVRPLPWPLEGSPEHLAGPGGAAEGWRQWNGGKGKTRCGGVRSLLALAWWTDGAGRKHFRLVARRGRFTRPQQGDFLGAAVWPPLSLVHPENVFLKDARGCGAVVAACACGACGAPEAVSWMGTRCGPCHDRGEEGCEGPKVWPDPSSNTDPTRTPLLAELHRVCFSADGRTLAVRDGCGGIRLWDLMGGECRSLVTHGEDGGGEPEEFSCVAFTPDGRYAVTGSRQGVVSRWEVATGARLTLSQQRTFVETVAVSPDGSLVAVAGPNGVECCPLPPCEEDPMFLKGRGWFRSLAFSPDGLRLAGGDWRGRVLLWDVATGAQLPNPPEYEDGSVHSLSFSADGRTLAVGLEPRLLEGGWRDPCPVLVWDVAGEAMRARLGPGRVHRAAVLTRDGRAVVTGGDDGALRVWDVSTGEETLALRWHRADVCSVAFSPDGSLLASVSTDGAAKVWPWGAVRDPG